MTHIFHRKFYRFSRWNFEEQLNAFVIFSLDEIFICSKTWQDHLDHIRAVLEILRMENLFDELSECIFRVIIIESLGQITSPSGVSVDQNEISTVMGWPVRKNR